MKKSGLVAILDSLLAYTIAFVAVGIAAILLMNPNSSDTRASYTLNIWAEDLADAVGMSLVDNITSSTIFWLADHYDPRVIPELNISLSSIAAEKELLIVVQIDNTPIIEIGNISKATKMATARRILFEVNNTYDPTGDVKVLTFVIGKK